MLVSPLLLVTLSTCFVKDSLGFVVPLERTTTATTTATTTTTSPVLSMGRTTEEELHDLQNQLGDRLEHLLSQYEEYRNLQQSSLEDISTVDASTTTSEPSSSTTTPDVVQEDTIDQHRQQQDHTTTLSTPDTSLLYQSKWKLVWSLGRETGTWMPVSWGASGKRVRISMVLEFTDTPVTSPQLDEFFQNDFGVRQLRVTEAVVLSYYDGPQFIGQRELKIDGGAYRVCEPHLLRFYIDLPEPLSNGDVAVAPGRLYGTTTCYDRSELSPHVRNRLDDAYWAAAAHYESLPRDMLTWDYWQRLPERFHAERRLERVTQAKSDYPDVAELRFSDQIGLGKDGGVCTKVQTNVATEYHILGRFQLAWLRESSKATP